ncbi:RIP metalloprotease RseP [Kyrpidia tusciae]|uniref:Zinc metalloprotease n=1 Tax=Kyrpidia tusciae (strain DSM 2912 / NBRC 15312 / T2) TaxID=562970 RepID=D5WPI5_KYRT2|nr:RIP metalloprotease RseP [Kyrpidia tusciae]ADG06244.1 membrane-associated zinc metalloprotease [Kyrpidia tusciae DSM 2912]
MIGGVQTAVAAIVIFLLLVVFHEFGHFYVAKLVGIFVREFAVGFGPKLFSRRWGETVYSLRALPLGGFVNMAGEGPEDYGLESGKTIAVRLDEAGQVEDFGDPRAVGQADFVGRLVSGPSRDDYSLRIEGEDGTRRYALGPGAVLHTEGGAIPLAPYDRQFMGKPVWARAATIFAGPLMNFVLAAVIFAVYFTIAGVPSGPDVAKVLPDSPAIRAGIQPGDHIAGVNGEPIDSWDQLVKTVQSRPDQRVVLDVIRGNQHLQVAVTPEVRGGVGVIGISPVLVHNPLASIGLGIKQTWDISVQIVQAFGRMITGTLAPEVAGPVGIVAMIGEQTREGLMNLLTLTALLSINLGIINLLPIPALDGSRLVFLLVETVRGRPVDPQKESMVHLVGFALLMVIVVLVTYKDVTRLF